MAGKIFINYRRGDDPGFAGRLFDRLEEAFTADRIFIDIDNIEPGLDFVRVLEDQVDRCDVLLAVIGPNWLTAKDENGERRLDNPNDFVRIEIESGLRLGKRIVPVLVNNADMPRAEHLPESLRPLLRRNAVRLTHERFKADAQGIVKQLEKALLDADAARQAAASAAEEDAKRRATEEAAKVAEAARQEKEKARLDAIAGLSAEQISKAEELANWDFIKDSKDEPDYRDHLARFPQGVTLRMARTRLETILWAKLGFAPTVDALEGFLAEFPDGARAAEAAKSLAKLKARTEKPSAPRARVTKKAEPAQAARTGEPSQTPKEEPAPAPSRMRKRWIGLAAFAAFYVLIVLLPSSAAFGWAGFIIAVLAGAALLWWLFAPTRRAEWSDAQAAVTAAPVDHELSWLSWAYAALAIPPLMYMFVHIANDADIYDLFDLIFYLSLAILGVALALAFAQRKTLSGAEVGLYWLGAALGAALAVFSISLKNGWLVDAVQKQLTFLLALIVLSAAGLAYWRRGRSSPTEISFYWLGSVLWLGLTAKHLFTFNEWSLLNVTDAFYGSRATGLLFALAVAVAIAFALLRYSKPVEARGSEVGVYWLGCTLLALPAFAWMFLGYQLNWYGTGDAMNQFTSGLLAAFIVAAISAAALVYLRRPVLEALEIACYWFGLTLAAMFAAANRGFLLTPSWADTAGWTAANTIVLAVALAAAGALAYLFSLRSDAGQRRARAPAEAVGLRSREQPDTTSEAATSADELRWPAWAYAALAVLPLLYTSVLYASEPSAVELLNSLFYLCLAALIAGPALAILQRTSLSGAEAGLYWLGAVLGGALAVILQSYQSGWTWTFPTSEAGGYIVLLALIVLSGAALAYLRRDRLTPVEVSLYWLGSVLWLGLTAKALFARNEWNLLGATDLYAAVRASGLLVGLLIAVASALALPFYRKPDTARGSEAGVYWLGCVLLALGAMPWLFDAYDWNWHSEPSVPNQLASGFVAAFVVAAISAAVLVYCRRPAFGALETGCYWAGLTLAALFAFDQSILVGVVWSTRQLSVLGVAILVAGGLAYSWNRPTLASLGDREFAIWRNPALRVWWIIAVLVLALILVFWLFASPPAQA